MSVLLVISEPGITWDELKKDTRNGRRKHVFLGGFRPICWLCAAIEKSQSAAACRLRTDTEHSVS
ncbi:hypothetical protein BJL95_12085 [Methylomonas sp. LWB]|nr:hypothetical protein BJL95_12085 [Methylomonas sp. LWB]